MVSSTRSTFDRLRLIRALDQMLWPLVLILARLLAKVPRKQSNRYVLIRPGGMGDLICLHLAVNQLGLNPHDFVWVIEKRSLPWAKMMGLEYRLISFKLLREVGCYRNVINSEQHYGASQIIAVSLAGRKRYLTSLSTVRGASISDKVVPYSPTRIHQVESFIKLLSLGLGSTVHTGLLSSSNSRTLKDELVVALGGGHSESRSLTLDQWTEVISKWTDGKNFVVISGPVESLLARQLEENFMGRAEYRRGGFEENCEVIKHAKRVLTIDGGLTHVASFFNTPADTLFTSGQEMLWSPISTGSRIFLRNDVPCRPCTMFGYTPKCPVGLLCTEGLGEVVEPAI